MIKNRVISSRSFRICMQFWIPSIVLQNDCTFDNQPLQARPAHLLSNKLLVQHHATFSSRAAQGTHCTWHILCCDNLHRTTPALSA